MLLEFGSSFYCCLEAECGISVVRMLRVRAVASLLVALMDALS